MSGERDDDQKTEEPTEKRLREAVEKGNVPRAREMGSLAMMAAAWLAVAMAAPGSVAALGKALLPLIENADDIRLDGGAQDVLGGLLGLIGRVGIALLPVLGLLVAGALVSAFSQGPVLVASERIQPKLSNISPMAGWRRIFGRMALLEFMKNLVKLGVVAAAGWTVVRPLLDRTEAYVGVDISGLPDLLRDLTLRLLLAVLLATVLIAGVDLVWRRLEWRKSLRMTQQEVRDEFKQMEGDPHIKARVREVRRERARRRMMAAVPKATVVVMNPTHFAVALEYERGRTPAPLCTAKGADLIALRIRAIAEEHGVPVVENPPLARALYKVVEVDQPIPAEHYRAVAELITYVMRLGGRRA
ncbi:flagellar biosynthesis protein FlhB [Arenibaculum pallidiluteum]|uniref:flagellar biosynthesis protein FlhB n=1 Tax=Arenibaculum pallidiluteum TaxID=2812559 RepID=UPI001A970C8D|nr:flagellar biosynthesis protein FlhB [Arenibaculum pallidiluteum]